MPSTLSQPCVFFFFNDTATTEIYTLSLHDALPIFRPERHDQQHPKGRDPVHRPTERSEEHTSELQSQSNLVCRLLLEKKNNEHCCSRSATGLTGQRPGSAQGARR